jgi:DNA-binding response OmpR family regulator
MLPNLDGIEICKRLKHDPTTRPIPVVMLTAKGEESDIVLGLGVGADDYLVKPFSPKELVARVKAVLRRGPLKDQREERERIALSAGGGSVVIDAGRHEVVVDGEHVIFTATEFKLLHFLAAQPGRVFTREQLINRVMGEDAVIIDRNIDVHVRSVRKKLGRHREMIETIRGVGYRFLDLDV